ncbi:hypothetical protein, partial [Rhodopseudomonas palustris]|uniref:hypothetical protein n=1 Tax=Rhodopseudomonas palustris TaxID=1076 RepID=UPI001AEC07A1
FLCATSSRLQLIEPDCRRRIIFLLRRGLRHPGEVRICRQLRADRPRPFHQVLICRGGVAPNGRSVSEGLAKGPAAT